MNHSFNIEDAKKYGVECAIILENLRFWIEKNRANERHFYDGKYWTYNSVKAFCELFPYWTENQIRRYLEKLESLDVISSGNYNQSPYDKTKWYCLNSLTDMANLPNRTGDNAKPIPDINTSIKPDKKHTRSKDEISVVEFVKRCSEKNEPRISKEDPLLEYAYNAGIPQEFLKIALDYMIDKFSDGQKKQKDWRAYFRNAIKGNWFKLWYFNDNQECLLTSVGIAHHNVMRNK